MVFLLSNCAACAAPLAHNAPRCVRCKTRYCDATCQHDHWRRGHKQICKKIFRGGEAEKYHAEQKYKEAVAVAVEKCAANTKGQTCYICTEGIKRRTGEGLVSGFCACRGGSSFAHVSCLAEQVKILWAEAEDNNLSNKVRYERWHRWHTCSLCEQKYHGAVACALGWACWKEHANSEAPALEDDHRNTVNIMALKALGDGLFSAHRHEEALSAYEASLTLLERLGLSREATLIPENDIVACYDAMGRGDEVLRMRREIHSRALETQQPETAFGTALNLAHALVDAGGAYLVEARSFLLKKIPDARHLLGDEHEVTMKLRLLHAKVVTRDAASSPKDMGRVMEDINELMAISRRVYGDTHPLTKLIGSGALPAYNRCQELIAQNKSRGK